MLHNNALGELGDSLAKAREFTECDFRTGLAEGETVFSPPHKKALATWQIYYNSAISPPLTVLNNLMPLLEQCETICHSTQHLSDMGLMLTHLVHCTHIWGFSQTQEATPYMDLQDHPTQGSVIPDHS